MPVNCIFRCRQMWPFEMSEFLLVVSICHANPQQCMFELCCAPTILLKLRLAAWKIFLTCSSTSTSLFYSVIIFLASCSVLIKLGAIELSRRVAKCVSVATTNGKSGRRRQFEWWTCQTFCRGALGFACIASGLTISELDAILVPDRMAAYSRNRGRANVAVKKRFHRYVYCAIAIFAAAFFAPELAWVRLLVQVGFDWIIVDVTDYVRLDPFAEVSLV